MVFDIPRVKIAEEYKHPYLGTRRIPLIRRRPHNIPVRLGKYIGGGAFASVYEHPTIPTRIYKVCTVNWDRGYFCYLVMLSRQKKQNPYFPIVFSATIYDYNDRSVAVVEMERLSPIDDPKWDCEECTDQYGYHYYKNLPQNDEAHIVDIFSSHDTVKRAFKDRWFAKGDYDLVNAFRKIWKTYHRYDRVPERGFNYDIHWGNIMVRNDGTFVITDPFCGGGHW